MLAGDLYPHPRHIDILPSMQSGGLGVAIRLAFHPKPALQGWTRAGSQPVLASNITIARIPQTLITFGRLSLREAYDTGDNIIFIHDCGIPTRNRYLTFKQLFFGLVPVTLQKNWLLYKAITLSSFLFPQVKHRRLINTVHESYENQLGDLTIGNFSKRAKRHICIHFSIYCKQ